MNPKQNICFFCLFFLHFVRPKCFSSNCLFGMILKYYRNSEEFFFHIKSECFDASFILQKIMVWLKDGI